MENLTRYLSDNFETWDVWKEKNVGYQLVYRNGELINTVKLEESGIGVRTNGLFYYSTNSDEKNVINQIKPKKESISIKQSSERGEFVVDYEMDVESLAKEIIDFLRDHNIKYELVVSCKIRDTFYVNSNGAEVRQKLIYNRFIVDLFYEESGNVSEVLYRQGSCLEPVKVDYEKFAEKIEILKNLAKAKTVKNQKTNVILDPEITDLLIHEAYGHALEIDYIQRKESVFSENKNVFLGEQVTIVEDPSQSTWSFYKYDDEGFRAKRKALVENGRIKGFIEDGRFGEGGWGRKESYEYYPIPRMACTILEPGNFTKEELIEEMKDGYILCGFRGGQVNPKNGNFQFGSEYAYEVKNGEVVRICKGMGFSGNILEVGKHIVARSRDLEESIGVCGKEGQRVPVSSVCPYVLLKDIRI